MSIRRLGLCGLFLAVACGRVGYPEGGGPVENDAGADAPGDAARADSGPDGCPDGLDADTLALYDMEDLTGGVLRDLTGAHPGSFTGAPQAVNGPPGCGSAVRFAGGAWALVPDAPEWDLEEGSVDLWVRPPAPSATGSVLGVLSRDADNTARPGHLSIFYAPDGRVGVRLQTPASHMRCTEAAVPPGRWVHIGVNLGPPDMELYVDGVRQESTARFPLTETIVYECGTPTASGISGNDNPWTIGASSGGSVEGEAQPVGGFLDGGAVDQLRISRVRRAFGG